MKGTWRTLDFWRSFMLTCERGYQDLEFRNWKMELSHVEVKLVVASDDDNKDLRNAMASLPGSWYDDSASTYHRLFPIALLRGCALALLPEDEEQCTTLKEEFDLQGLDLTPEGLHCIIEACNAFLQD